MTTGQPGDELLELSIVAAQAAPFRCFGNVLVEPHASIEDGEPYDVIIVCDLYTPIMTAPGDRFAREAAVDPRAARRRVADRLGLHGLAAPGRKRACSMADRAPGIGPMPTCSGPNTRR